MNIKYSVLFTLPFFLVLSFPFVVVCAGCKERHSEFKSPTGYNLNEPYAISLPSELKEISGLSYYAKDSSIFAESDAKGNVYKIPLNKPTDIKKWSFGFSRDYEDIVQLDSNFYVLNSNGDISSIRFSDDSAQVERFKFPEENAGEFETLYFDGELHKLVLVCKHCTADDKNVTSAFTFDMQQHVYARAYAIQTAGIPPLNGDTPKRLKPSAAAIHPLTGELYLLSAVNKMIVVADRHGTVKAYYPLDPQIFNHPEGLTFSPSGGLFISNEGEQLRPATLLCYKYLNTTKR